MLEVRSGGFVVQCIDWFHKDYEVVRRSFTTLGIRIKWRKAERLLVKSSEC